MVVGLPFLQLRHASFTNFDDPSYVTANAYVRQGITLEAVLWALGATEMGSWHPLTWLSHLSDVELFGMNAGGHHLTSVGLHLVNVLLLFLVLCRLGCSEGRSALIALLFGIHPLHVESVAWISERKDVLSTTFLFLALWAYAGYVARPSVWRYLRIVIAFTLGLMSKPMLVTFPFILVLLDVWPLRRFAHIRKTDNATTIHSLVARYSLLEKLPFVIMSGSLSILTLITQRVSVGSYPLSQRLANAAVAYIVYMRKLLWPVDLAFFYPYPPQQSWWRVLLAMSILGGISFIAIRETTRPYIFVGWCWFVGMLVPVIGLVQVGSQALADRYTYVPIVGLFIVIVVAASDAADRWLVAPLWRHVIIVVIGIACAAMTWRQVSYWHDDVALFQHALDVTSDNYRAYLQLGEHYAAAGETEAASQSFLAALRIKPDYAEAHGNLGLMLAREGKLDAAFAHYEAALREDPLYADAHYNRGLLLQQTGHLGEAADEYRHALELQPTSVEAHSNLGVILLDQGALGEARDHFVEALHLRPDHVNSRINLGVALRATGDLQGALTQYREALRLNPASPEAHYNLGNVLLQSGNLPAAIGEYREALHLRPDYEAAHQMLERAVAHQAG